MIQNHYILYTILPILYSLEIESNYECYPFTFVVKELVFVDTDSDINFPFTNFIAAACVL